MQQPKPISSLVQTPTTHPTSSSSVRPTTLSKTSDNEKRRAIIAKYSRSEDFLARVNPDTAPAFARNTSAAIMGDYPTLADINIAYGPSFSQQWLVPQIASLALYTGAKNIDTYQQRSLASVIATEYYYLKVTELLLFFYRFKTGRYGRFYGSVDPMVITCALRDFINERNELLERYELEERERKEIEEKKRNPPMTREEWLEIKTLIAMYNSDYTV